MPVPQALKARGCYTKRMSFLSKYAKLILMSGQRYRLSDYSYSKARSYMVTLKMHLAAAPLSVLDSSKKSGLRYTTLTKPFISVITKRLLDYFDHTIAVNSFVLMPNHLHLLIHIHRTTNQRQSNLVRVVEKLILFLNEAYKGIYTDVTFDPVQSSWDDSIAFTREAEMRMRRYIKQNPQRALLRSDSSYCKRKTYLAKDGRKWWFYGNFDLVKRPTILAVECSRKICPASPLWNRWQTAAKRITTGCAAIGTFMSPCEKMTQTTILQAGGALIILLPEGISPYWHPGEEMERYCAQGRILYLTPFEHEEARPSAAVLYARCHANGGLKEILSRLACNTPSLPRE